MQHNNISLKFKPTAHVTLGDLNNAYGDRGVTFPTEEDALTFLSKKGYTKVNFDNVYKCDGKVAYVTKIKDHKKEFSKKKEFKTLEEAKAYIAMQDKDQQLMYEIRNKPQKDKGEQFQVFKNTRLRRTEAGYLVTLK